MGFGISLATGFLQGTVDAAREKKQDELLEQERQDALAATAGSQFFDAVAAGFDPKSEFMQNLGKQAFGDKYDFSTVGNIIADVDGTTALGSYKLPFETQLGKFDDAQNTLFQYETWLSENADTLRQDMMNNPNLARVVRGYTERVFSANNMFYFKEMSGKNDDGLVTKPAYRRYDEGGTNNFNSLLKDFGIIGKSKFRPAATYAGQDELAPNSFLYPETQGKDGGQAKIMNYGGLKTEYGVPKEGYESVAAIHGMENPDQLWTNTDHLLYGTNEGMQIKTISDGAKLAAANAGDLLLLEGGASRTTLDNTVQTLNAIGGDTNDIGAMRRAAYVIIPADPEFETAPPSAQTFISGSEYMEGKGFKVGDFREQQTANNEAVEMLLELQQLQAEYGRTGIAAKIDKFALGLVGQGKQLAEMFGGGSEYADFGEGLVTEDGTSRGSLMAVAKDYVTDIEKLSKMDALRLTLAAKMARAVDPSGRLSDQDFKIQLERLGGTGWFTDTKGELAKLGTVISEFKKRQEEMNTIGSVISKANITVEDRRFLKATTLVNTAQRHERKMRAEGRDTTGLTTQDQDVPEEESEFFTAADLGFNENTVADNMVKNKNDPDMELYPSGGFYYAQTPQGYVRVPNTELEIVKP
jgi:hypothetical protein